MVVAAILVLGEGSSVFSAPSNTPCSVPRTAQLEPAPGCTIPLLELLGQSTLQRTVAHLRAAGVASISVVTSDSVSEWVAEKGNSPARFVVNDHPVDVSLASQQLFAEYRNQGIQTVLLIALGAYVEFDLADLMRFHRDRGRAVTRLSDQQGPLDFWVLDPVRCTAIGKHHSALCPLDGKLEATYRRLGYVNRMEDAADIREFVTDTLLSRCLARPAGRENRPGVWMEDGAAVHPRSRIVAPAYIGAGAAIRSGALITRSSHVERGCDVGCGTVVEHSSILAGTYLGAWLNFSNVMVSGGHVVHLHRHVAVAINDPKLLGKTASWSDAQSRKSHRLVKEWINS